MKNRSIILIVVLVYLGLTMFRNQSIIRAANPCVDLTEGTCGSGSTYICSTTINGNAGPSTCCSSDISSIQGLVKIECNRISSSDKEAVSDSGESTVTSGGNAGDANTETGGENDGGTGATQSLGRIGEGKGLGPFSNIAESLTDAGTALENAFSAIIGVITGSAGLWFMIQLFIGGYGWLSAGGDPKALEGARERITNGIIGLIIVISAWAVVGIAGAVVGLDILNPATILINIAENTLGLTPP